MAVISISITESEEQIVSGIPKSISIATNIPTTIFYTLDGTDPTIFSEIYTTDIYLSTSQLSITLKVLATDGTSFSSIVTEIYQTDILDNTRFPHSATDAAAGSNLPSLYPFGTNPVQPTSTFLNPGEAGVTVDDPNLPQLSNAFDSNGNPSVFTNEEYNLQNYSIVYSTTDSEGISGLNIGNLPAEVIVPVEEKAPEETNQFTTLFNPRAFVIFQDVASQDPSDPACINRQFFSLDDPEKVSDGNSFFNSGPDTPCAMGAFLRSHYNPRDRTITYYYFDSHANKWIISKAPYTPVEGGFDGNLSAIPSPRGRGSEKIYEWLPYARRVLF